MKPKKIVMVKMKRRPRRPTVLNYRQARAFALECALTRVIPGTAQPRFNRVKKLYLDAQDAQVRVMIRNHVAGLANRGKTIL